MQINRLFEIIYLLLNKKSITAGELAEHFEVSRRTIYRDVETLSSAAIPVYMRKGKGGGISLLPDFILNKTVLTEAEQADILSSIRAVNAVSLAETDTALHKLSSLFGEPGADWIEVDFSPWANVEEETAVFNALKSAILGKCLVQFTYASGRGETASRTVEPLKLYFKGQGWYVYGFCTAKEDFRLFKLRRIKHLTVLKETFTRSAPRKIFKEENRLQDDAVTITLKLSKEMAFRVYDEFEQFEPLADGSFIVKLTLPRGEGVFHYLATFGDTCEVLEPLDIRLEVKDKLQKNLNRYL
ncbi:helix-turn-helix transcriptional regulator [Paenibacillus donghaensis]|uniref:Transcriptional regulator n=1 Tax=Paenibacillus donghaensis TaxID=414771 RepID=A0A2Z2KUM1_9BACL|nr:YafY family protein [Paenibacillus donghaensis]ASA25812.1 transcriptional regulator [Paenibacillus donghaensis]